MDARSDIYSLGVLLFEMATGRRPFTGDEPGLTQTGTTTRLQEAHLRLPPPEPRSLNPKLPAAASAVILRALAKRPADRWPDAVSLREAWEAAVGVTAATAGGRDPARAAARPTLPGRPGGLSRGGLWPWWGSCCWPRSRPWRWLPAGRAKGRSWRRLPRRSWSRPARPSVLTVPPPTAQPVQGGGVVQVGKPAPETATQRADPAVVDATAASIGTPEITAAGTTTDTLSAPGEPTLIPTLHPLVPTQGAGHAHPAAGHAAARLRLPSRVPALAAA